MLPLRFQQIKNELDKKNQASSLSTEERELLKEINFLEDNILIQKEIQQNIPQSDPPMDFASIAPTPTNCPACGTKLKQY